MVLKETAPPFQPHKQHLFTEGERERGENNITTNREIPSSEKKLRHCITHSLPAPLADGAYRGFRVIDNTKWPET